MVEAKSFLVFGSWYLSWPTVASSSLHHSGRVYQPQFSGLKITLSPALSKLHLIAKYAYQLARIEPKRTRPGRHWSHCTHKTVIKRHLMTPKWSRPLLLLWLLQSTRLGCYLPTTLTGSIVSHVLCECVPIILHIRRIGNVLISRAAGTPFKPAARACPIRREYSYLTELMPQCWWRFLSDILFVCGLRVWHCRKYRNFSWIFKKDAR